MLWQSKYINTTISFDLNTVSSCECETSADNMNTRGRISSCLRGPSITKIWQYGLAAGRNEPDWLIIGYGNLRCVLNHESSWVRQNWDWPCFSDTIIMTVMKIDGNMKNKLRQVIWDISSSQ